MGHNKSIENLLLQQLLHQLLETVHVSAGKEPVMGNMLWEERINYAILVSRKMPRPGFVLLQGKNRKKLSSSRFNYHVWICRGTKRPHATKYLPG